MQEGSGQATTAQLLQENIFQTSPCTQGAAGGWSAPANADRKVKVEQDCGIPLGNGFPQEIHEMSCSGPPWVSLSGSHGGC